MDNCKNACEFLNTGNNKVDIILAQLQKEIKELCKTSTAKFLMYDEKVSELCVYIKENLSNSLRCLFDDMKSTGELDKIITDAVLNEIKLIEFNLDELNKKTTGIITPQMFGAHGDGICDDTEAFKKAVESGYKIYIPKGKYILTDTIQLKGNEYITGTKESVLIVNTETLFNITAYYNQQCILENFAVELNKNTFIKADKGAWGVSYALKDLCIKKCGGNTIVNDEGYNITLKNCIFESDSSATGTMIKLCGNDSKTFTNVFVLDSCVISGNENMDLVDCSKSYRVNAYNTTFTGCRTAIIGVMGCFGCWFETVELCSTGKSAYFECHFADITRMNAKTKDEDDNYIIPSLVANPTFKGSNTTLLAEVFKRQPQQLFYPKVAGNINGAYSEFLPFSIYSNKVISNVPINTYYKEGTGNSMSLPIPEITSANKGVLFVELECYRVLNGEVKQASKSKGILKDNVYTELEKADKDSTYKSTFTWNAPNQLFTITDWHEGTLIAKCHIERVTA